MAGRNTMHPNIIGARVAAQDGQALTPTTHLSEMRRGKTGRDGIKETKQNNNRFTSLMEAF